MVKQVFRLIQDEKMFSKGDRVLVGVSGGADSVCLLLLLADLRHRCSFSLTVACYDHQMRKDSSYEVSFVRELALSLGCAFVTEKRKGKKPQSSVEDYLRDLRYDFFSRMAKQHQMDVLALAHTQTDQAETLLMRLLRGAGLEGARAILPVRQHHHLKVVRPLLETSRLEIEKYLKTKKQKYCMDSSNDENIFLRNIIRNKIFPMIKKETRYDLSLSLSRFSRLIQDDYDFLYQQASKDYQKRINAQGTTLSVVGWKNIHPAIRKMLIKIFLQNKDVSAHHIQKIDQNLLQKQDFQYPLSDSFQVRAQKGKMVFRILKAR